MYWEKIEGSFSFINFYEKMVNRFNNAIFVEIGTWKGQSLMYMAERIKYLNKNIKLYGIDTFKGNVEHAEHPDVIEDKVYEIYLQNIEPLKEYINTIKGNSHDVYDKFDDESIDFLFLDGDHSYEAVKKDLKLWYPKIKKGGIISGHDYMWVDARVKRAVDEFFLFTGIFPDDGDSWYKVKPR